MVANVHRPPIGFVQGAPDLLDPSYLGMPAIGTQFWVDPAGGNDGNSGRHFNDAFKTLTTAYTATTANKNDVVWLIGNNGSISLSATLTWAKNYTHLLGWCAPTRTAQRARIFQTASATGLSPLLDITASGCIFSNFYIFQGVADATSLINVRVRGGRNYFSNVHFAGGGHATQAIDGGASLALISDSNGSCEENTFVNCTVGVDTIDSATGMVALTFDGEAHRNYFDHCTFRLRAGSTGTAFVEVIDTTGIDRDNTFDNCVFINNSTSNDMASAFLIPAMGEPRVLLLKDCMFHNVTKLDASDRGVLFGNMNAITGADLSGVAVQLVS